MANGKRYILITDTVYNSIAFRTLPGGALKLWMDMRTQFRGSNNGSIMVTLRVLQHRGWNSSSKLVRAMHELLERGLIAYTRHARKNAKHQASLFAFTDIDTAANARDGVVGAKATHEYLKWLQPAKSEAPFSAFPKRERNDS
jgi:hypothetical protein